MKSQESHIRSVTKGLSWRIIGTIDTLVLAYLFTGNLNIALSIGATELFTKLALFYIHERIWLKIKWGHKKK